MSDLHAIFRQLRDGRWQAYSRPVGVFAAGPSFTAAQDEFLRAAEFHFDDDWQRVRVVQHVEDEAVDGVFIRTAIDRAAGRRERTANALRNYLHVPAGLAAVRATALESSTGDTVFVCCEPEDLISWVSDQLGRTDTVQVTAPLTAGAEGYWWMPLAAPAAAVPPGESESLSEAGLDGADAVVDDLFRSMAEFGGHVDGIPDSAPDTDLGGVARAAGPVLVAAR